MKIIVDTSVWSEAFRRNYPLKGNHALELARLIDLDVAVLIGPIRQELLSGIANEVQFHRLRDALLSFTDLTLDTDDFVDAAGCFNQCRQRGIQGAHNDFLICAVAMRRRFPIFTVDKDFANYAKVLPIKLYKIRAH